MQKQNESYSDPAGLSARRDSAGEKSDEPESRNLYPYFSQLLSLQLEVNQQLYINHMLTENYIKQMDEPNGKASSSEGSTLAQKENKIKSGDLNQKRLQQIKVNGRKRKQRKQTKCIKPYETRSDSDYQPSEEKEALGQYKLSESKNVPKNYGKAILGFIKKSQEFVRRVVHKFSINYEQFLDSMQNQYKNNINTIAELRALWINDLCPYATVLRIISAQYLRKYSLSHIFNSRVENHGKHIKYRNKILKAIEKPQEFTLLKDF